MAIYGRYILHIMSWLVNIMDVWRIISYFTDEEAKNNVKVFKLDGGGSSIALIIEMVKRYFC